MCQFECKINGVNYALVIPSILQLVLGIVAIAYGSMNLEESCSDSFIHLAVWMIVQGAIMLFVSVGFIPAILLGPIGLFVYAIVATLYGVFNVIWSIIGAVVLWRDSLACEDLDPIFYSAGMAVVICSLILAFCSCCCSNRQIREHDQNNDQ